MSIFGNYQTRYEDTEQEEYGLNEYLEICKADSTAYATAAERLLLAIGEPEQVDTSKDARLSRIFSNKIIMRYLWSDYEVDSGLHFLQVILYRGSGRCRCLC